MNGSSWPIWYDVVRIRSSHCSMSSRRPSSGTSTPYCYQVMHRPLYAPLICHLATQFLTRRIQLQNLSDYAGVGNAKKKIRSFPAMSFRHPNGCRRERKAVLSRLICYWDIQTACESCVLLLKIVLFSTTLTTPFHKKLGCVKLHDKKPIYLKSTWTGIQVHNDS